MIRLDQVIGEQPNDYLCLDFSIDWLKFSSSLERRKVGSVYLSACVEQNIWAEWLQEYAVKGSGRVK